jgi:hypothetical protein
MALVSVGAGMLGVVFAVGCVETALQWKRRSRAVTPLSGSGISLAIIGYLLLALCLLIVLRIGQAVPEGRAALESARTRVVVGPGIPPSHHGERCGYGRVGGA